ncbi:DoxX family protein [Balneolaceae bacterium YR4-1]|uniref:DoxX family protein n=1 Tax=Halalkalibaculum roseum TaxID=2709311 RepID=A0A6M1SU72_9BACT|nr:DoxX family protein [Halalkalibaculum roseum]
MEDIQISRSAGFISWLFQILSAIILLQTLYFKFSGSPESVQIFETVGMEPWGRFASGIVEFIAGLLLLVPGLSWLGALLGLSIITVALLLHITVLGFEVMGDGGALFYLATTVFISCCAILWIRRAELSTSVKKWLS